MADPEKQAPPPDQTVTTTTQSQPAGFVTVNKTYLISPRGILKIGEIFFLLIAFACAASAMSVYVGHGYVGDRYSFFMFTTVTPWLICIIIFVLYVFCIVEKIPQVNWTLTVLINSIVWAVLLLISSSLMADSVSFSVHSNPIVNKLRAATVFGFFALIVFLIDIFFHVKMVRG